MLLDANDKLQAALNEAKTAKDSESQSKASLLADNRRLKYNLVRSLTSLTLKELN